MDFGGIYSQAGPLKRQMEADGVLAAELGIIGQALVELAAHVNQIGAAFGQVDEGLGRQARAVR